MTPTNASTTANGSITNAAPDDDVPEVRFENRIRYLDIVDLVFTRAILSPGMQLFAGFLITLGLLGVLGAMPPDLWVPLLITGLAVGTGLIFLPFTWTTYMAVPELMNETVEADASGMRIHVMDRIVEHPFSVYRAASETDRLFILRSRIVPTQIFTKRGMQPPEIEAFREILREAGALTDTAQGERRKAWIGFIVGAVLAIVLPLGFTLLTRLAPA
ncbi:MAG TPA: hypothetical protein VNL94_03960 [Candidatus Binatia bacterium]|nr:hypothetical protein [Candidatus Binatia bacterium]